MSTNKTIDRLEKWKSGNRMRSVTIEIDNGYGANCWLVAFRHEHGQTQAYEAQFWGGGPSEEDKKKFIDDAKEMGTVFVDWGDGDWPGLAKTIDAAIDAFEAGIWGARK